MEFVSRQLENGLEIVAECNADAHSMAIGFFVRTGARDETGAESGVSHFLEHMLFKGTATRTADDVNREFDAMGAVYNAETSEEHTLYFAATLPEYQDRALGLLSDILRPALRREDFDLEKQVILEEIRMYDDEPPFGAQEKVRAAHFGSHPLGQSVLGTVESVTQLSVEAMRAYFDRRYSPANVTLVASGKVDFAGLVRSAERCCGSWPALAAGRTITPAVPHTGFEVLCKPTAAQQYFLHLSTGPSAEDDDRFAAAVLATVLGDYSGSRLYWELVDPGLAESAQLSHCEHQGAGMMMSFMCCDPEAAADNWRRVLAVYRRAAADGISPAELQQAKNKLRSRIVLPSERPLSRLFMVGYEWVARRQYRTVADDLDAVAAVTLDDLSALMARHPLDRGATITVGPLEELPGLP